MKPPRWRWLARLASVRTLARLVDPSLRFALRELGGRSSAYRYRVRGVGATVVVRHNSSDVWTLNEVFNLRTYEPPAEVAARLRSLGRPPRVLDLGANVGMYGALVQAEHPGATVLAYEPDPRNLAVHKRCMALGGSPPGWKLVEACAATDDGQRTFDARGDDSSSVTTDGRGIRVEARDVLPELARADLAKLDVEGSEWEILADPRFGAVPAVIVEYHPERSPGGDTRHEATRLLADAGYITRQVFHEESGIGAIWGFKPASASEDRS